MESTFMSSYLIQGAAIGLTASASPGAFQTYLINQTLTGGIRSGAPVAFSVLISDPLIVITILWLLNQFPPQFLPLISTLGGIFVLYLAWSFWRKWRNNNPSQEIGTQSEGFSKKDSVPPATYKRSIMGRAAMINLLSPGPYTFWALVLGPLLLSALEQSSRFGVVFLIGFYSSFIGGMLGIVMIFHLARRLGPGIVRTLTLLSIIILVVFGALLILSGLRQIL